MLSSPQVMRALRRAPLLGMAIAAFAHAPIAYAQGPTDGAAPAADTPAELTPPTLKTHPDPVYPPDAQRDRIEGSVGLELTVDEEGKVEGARVTKAAGHGFDEAALTAVKTWTFEPAKKDGTAIKATVQLALPFVLQTPAPVVPVAPQPPKPPPVIIPPLQTGPAQSTLVLAQRPISAASSFAVQDKEFSLRPIGSVQDILRVTPGLTMVQHSGGGKANQYFLRGFDADHGTDLALSIDGIPINMVSHAHGQGYADTNFIIPETVQRVEITKGPYFANQGDFATAGSVNLVTRDDFEHSSVGLGFGGSPGHGAPSYRGLLIASPKFENVKTMFAAEVGRQDGPFDNPEGWNKYKLFNKLTYAISPTSSITIGEASYSGNWYGSGQIPTRALEQGLISRFGSIDPTEGGNTARHQLFVGYKIRPSENSELNALAFIGAYRFNLYSNFTLFETDPNRGDEIQQIDNRTFYGGRVSYRVAHEIEGLRFDTTIGANGRSDAIHEELWHAQQRVQLDQLRGNNVNETLIGAFVNEEVTPAKWFRLVGGLRADFLGFTVDNRLASGDPLAPRSGVGGGQQLSPKASAIVTPLDKENAHVDVYANFGNGFHTNDVRGVFTNPSVTPITRAIGEEVGSRGHFFDRLDVAAAFWRMTLDQETTWNGDEGTTNVGPGTTRYGAEFEALYAFNDWLAADGNITFTHSKFSTDNANGGGLALAPVRTWAGGLSARHDLGPGQARGGLRFYGISDRPASDDGAIVATGFTQFDLHLGYRTRRFDVAFDIENLLNGVFRSAQFATISRLRTEPGIGTPLNRLPKGFGCGSSGRIATDPTTGGHVGAVVARGAVK
ncbi:MAG: TonB family protein, partial [Polyangiaceae bacterium]